MGKISPVASKYTVKAQLDAAGVVEKPDVVGAIFGQTEGLLGSDLELRELQKSGRIGRIEVNVTSKIGKSSGIIEIPSSMDKAETAIIAAALETIDRIGPCTAKIKTIAIEDVRVSKRQFIVTRAKELLKRFVKDSLPDTQEITDAVRQSVRTSEIVEMGIERTAAGPDVATSEEIIVVEGRADVLNLLKHGIKNGVAMDGTHVPKAVKDLSRQKTVTLFVDGDRGGDLIFKALKQVAEIDFIARAPSGLEVEELTQKEIYKALRARMAVEQIRESVEEVPSETGEDAEVGEPAVREETMEQQGEAPSEEMGGEPDMAEEQLAGPAPELDDERKNAFRKFISELVGTRGAYILNDRQEVLGKVPLTELQHTLEGVTDVETVILDGIVTSRLVDMLKNKGIKYVLGMRKMDPIRTPDGMEVLTPKDLE